MNVPWFPKEEYDLRHARARELMAEENLDALLATDVINYTYLGGHRIPGLTPWRARPFVLILPMKRNPVLIGQLSVKQNMMKTSWIKNIKTWIGMPFTIETVKESLEELDLTDGRIGCELGLEDRLGISYNDFMSLKKSLPKADFVDGSEVFWRLRVIKSKAEIECIRETCKVTSKAYEKTFNTVEKGMTVEDVKYLMVKFIKEDGLELHFAMPRIYPAATGSYLKRGDVLWIDSGAVCKGYRCDFSRMVAVGVASDKGKKMYSVIREITWKLINMVRPGVKVSDIAKVCSIEHKKFGLGNWKLEALGRIGHGLGLGSGHPYKFGTELPSINCFDKTVLEPGMIITLEPGELTDYGYFTLEENLVVTSNGYELLSQASDVEIRVI